MKARILLIALFGCSSFAFAGSSLKSEIQSMNDMAAKMLMKKDVDGFMKAIKPGVTSDFKYIEEGRAENFDAMAGMMKQGMAGFSKMVKVHANLVSLKETGSTAVANTKHVMVGVMAGKGKPHTMAMTGLSVDTYKKQNGKWKLATMSWKSTTMTMDGKPFTAKMGQGK